MDKQTPQGFFGRALGSFEQQAQVHKNLMEIIVADGKAYSQHGTIEDTFIHQTLEYLAQPPEGRDIKFEVVTYLQPALVAGFPELPVEIQDAVRAGLLNVVVESCQNTKAVGALGLLVREIIELDSKVKDGFEEWVDPMGELIKWMGSDQPGVAEAGVEFFIFLLKETQFNSTNSQLPLHKMASPLLQTCFQLFTSAPQEETAGRVSLREKILYLALQVVKSFSYFDGNNDALVRQCFGDSVELWSSLLVSILKSSVASHLGIKKYALKMFIVIFRDMSNLCQSRLKSPNAQAELLAAWQFAYKFLPCYLAAECWGLSRLNQEAINNQSTIAYFDDDYDVGLNPVEAIAHNILEMLSVFASSGLLNMVIKVSIYHLLNALFHYYIISSLQLRTWSCNNLHLVALPDHESIRGKILNILNDIIEKNGDYAIQALLLIAEKFLMNHPQSHTADTISKIVETMNIKEVLESGRLELHLRLDDILKFTQVSGCDVKDLLKVRGETWRKSEVALSILGRFSEDIIVFQSRQQAAFDIENFVKGLMKQFEIEDYDPSACLLKGQSLYCLTRFTEIISIRYKHLFTDLVTSCSLCVDEQYQTAIRIAACKSLTIFFRKIDKHKLKLSQAQVQSFEKNKVAEGIMTIEATAETSNYCLEALIELVKCLGPDTISEKIGPLFILDSVHKSITHANTQKLCFAFLQNVCQSAKSFERIILGREEEEEEPVILHFIQDCLETFMNVVRSEQKNYLKPLDIELIAAVLKTTNIVLQKCPAGCAEVQTRIVTITPVLTEILKHNENLQIHVACTICLKNLIRLLPKLIKEHGYDKNIVEAIRCLLKVPKDKSFEGASVYVGNLILLTFELLLEKPDQEIMQEVVLKVFKSRTPSVIQSLVLVYARIINGKTDASSPFSHGEWETKLRNMTDFLASFSIENRMGLKILVDKWLLQQSLFRGNFTKISTFMALSKMFLLRDKRIDNLLVIGFNPSHTNINNDVNAPLKILATLIRCLHNEMGGKGDDNEIEEEAPNFDLKDEPEKVGIDVGLEKFKEAEEAKNETVGGLADRENQQGSTCYMSAMLQFYDDGEECDETTEQDLIFLKDSSTKFTLSQYLTDFFLYLNNPETPNHAYFLDCLKQLLKEDLKTLQKYVKVNL